MPNSWPENQWETHAINLPVGMVYTIHLWPWMVYSWVYHGFTLVLPWFYHGFTIRPAGWPRNVVPLRVALSLYDTSLRILATASERVFSRAWEPCFDGNKNGGANAQMYGSKCW